MSALIKLKALLTCWLVADYSLIVGLPSLSLLETMDLSPVTSCSIRRSLLDGKYSTRSFCKTHLFPLLKCSSVYLVALTTEIRTCRFLFVTHNTRQFVADLISSELWRHHCSPSSTCYRCENEKLYIYLCCQPRTVSCLEPSLSND